MSNCADCNTRLAIDERISHLGKIVCGNCFIKMPQEIKVSSPTTSLPAEKHILDIMEMIVNLDERIKILEEKIGLLDIQFDSICG